MKPEQTFHFDLDETFPHLENAPIVEAVIQWVARAAKTLTPDDLRQQLAERLRDYPDCQPQRAFRMEAQFGLDGSSRQVQQETWQGFRCTSPDKLHIAQFNRDGVLFSRLKPYQAWEAFSAEAMRVWNVFVAVAQPAEIERLAVRFINRIEPIALADLPKYLKVPRRRCATLACRLPIFFGRRGMTCPDIHFR
ncbi:MAG: TIGR04255 family protein [Pirellulales bacterium]